MIRIPDNVQDGALPSLFVHVAAQGRHWRYTDAKRAVEWDGAAWQHGSSILVEEVKDELLPSYLTPLPPKPKPGPKRVFAGPAHTVNTLINPAEGWREWFDLMRDGGDCDVVSRVMLPLENGDWFVLQTNKGKAVDAVAETTDDGGTKVVVKFVGPLYFDVWLREGYSAHEVVDLMEHLGAADVSIKGDESGWFKMVVGDTQSRQWVVGRSQDESKMWNLTRATMRVMNRRRPASEGVFLERLYKYTEARWAEEMLDGIVQISADHAFGDVGPGLAQGQIDNEIVKVTKLPGLVESTGQSEDVMMESSYDNDKGELRMKSAPYWMWCCSASRNFRLLREFKNATVAVEITDVPDFLKRLTAAVREELGEDYLQRDWGGMVDYENHKDFVVYGLGRLDVAHPSLLKNREFEHQQEFRCVWAVASRGKRKHLKINMGSNRHCARVLHPGAGDIVRQLLDEIDVDDEYRPLTDKLVNTLALLAVRDKPTFADGHAAGVRFASELDALNLSAEQTQYLGDVMQDAVAKLMRRMPQIGNAAGADWTGAVGFMDGFVST